MTTDRDRTWAGELVRRVGNAAKAARGGKSAAWLSDRTAELGYRISPTVIAKLDSGHRGEVLGVAELLILAAALGVPPMALLFPGMPDEQIEIIPGHTGKSWAAYLWATGMAPSFVNPGAAPTDGEQLISAVRERSELLVHLAHLHVELGTKTANEYDPLRKTALEERRIGISDRINQLNAIICDAGGVINDA